MADPLRILMVEDSNNDVALLLLELRRTRLQFTHERVDTAQAMRAALDSHCWDVIIADYAMPQFSGPAALALAREHAADVPFILVSGTIGEETAVQAMKAGADDYLYKGDLKRLATTIERELRAAALRRKAKLIEQQSRKRETHLADALQLARVGTWHLDICTNTAVWSDETCRIVGFKADKASPAFEALLDRLFPKDRTVLLNLLQDPATRQFTQDLQVMREDETTQFIQIRGDIIRDGNSRPIEAAGMIQDITEQKRFEEILQEKNTELQNANLAKDRFLASMSHELRTPLNAILGFTGTLLMKLPGPLTGDQEKQLLTVKSSGKLLLSLINDLLDLAKIESGKLELHPEPMLCRSLLDEVSTALRPMAEAKNLALEVELSCPDLTFTTDRRAFTQILLNLANNAIKFTETGRVRIVVDRHALNGESIIAVRVIDTGIGIQPEGQSRLFQAFEQMKADGHWQEGTGLGLHISQKLAKLLDGHIEFQSEYGKGSTFTLTVKEH